MPRRARLTLPDIPLHIIQRGNNRQTCFFTPTDYTTYLRVAGRICHQGQIVKFMPTC
jgi:putative transposase